MGCQPFIQSTRVENSGTEIRPQDLPQPSSTSPPEAEGDLDVRNQSSRLLIRSEDSNFTNEKTTVRGLFDELSMVSSVLAVVTIADLLANA